MAPFGVISSSILVPVLPILVAVKEDSQQLAVTADILTSLACILVPVACFMTVLARPLVTLMLSGKAFQEPEIVAVAGLLPYVALAGAVGVMRELIVRVHYARGNASYPMRVTCIMMAVNAALDVLSDKCGWGAIGLVATTAATSAVASLCMWNSLAVVPSDESISSSLVKNLLSVIALTVIPVGGALATREFVASYFGEVTFRSVAAVTCAASAAVGTFLFIALLLCVNVPGLAGQRASVLKVIPARLIHMWQPPSS